MENDASTNSKTAAVRLGSGLAIYKQPKRPGRGSPNWYARAIVSVGGRRVHVKSTGTSDRPEAIQRAEAFKAMLLIQRQQEATGHVSSAISLDERPYQFDRVVDSFLQAAENGACGDDRRTQRVKDHRKILLAENGPCAFFKKENIRSINVGQIQSYLTFANTRSKAGRLKPSTERNHLSTLRQVFQHAHDNGLIPSIPRMPTIRMKDDPRPTFSAQEYHLLRRICISFERHARRERRHDEALAWQELRDFIVFMVNSFLRPSEWVHLRQKHIEVVDGESPYLRITVLKGKTRKRVAVTMPGAVRAFQRIVRRCGSDPEKHLFLPEYGNRSTAQHKMRKRFQNLLNETGLTHDSFGRKRETYSLRHTALMLRVLNGDNVDRLALARNAGTSMQMLERFYCSHLDPEAKIANLQSFLNPNREWGRQPLRQFPKECRPPRSSYS